MRLATLISEVVTVTTLVREPATRAPAAAPAARLRKRAAGRFRGTPGRLVLATVALVVLGLATGVAGVVGVRQRAGLVDGAVAQSGELAVAAQRLYRALSDADATAASAFLEGGVEPVALRERYQADIADAAAARATAGVPPRPPGSPRSCRSTPASWRPLGSTTARACRWAARTCVKPPA